MERAGRPQVPRPAIWSALGLGQGLGPENGSQAAPWQDSTGPGACCPRLSPGSILSCCVTDRASGSQGFQFPYLYRAVRETCFYTLDRWAWPSTSIQWGYPQPRAITKDTWPGWAPRWLVIGLTGHCEGEHRVSSGGFCPVSGGWSQEVPHLCWALRVVDSGAHPTLGSHVPLKWSFSPHVCLSSAPLALCPQKSRCLLALVTVSPVSSLGPSTQ